MGSPGKRNQTPKYHNHQLNQGSAYLDLGGLKTAICSMSLKIQTPEQKQDGGLLFSDQKANPELHTSYYFY